MKSKEATNILAESNTTESRILRGEKTNRKKEYTDIRKTQVIKYSLNLFNYTC